MNEKVVEKILKSFANRRRIAIIKYLKKKDKAAVGDIAKEIKLSFRSTSRHLAILYSVEIIDKKQKNLSVFYSISKNQNLINKKIISLL